MSYESVSSSLTSSDLSQLSVVHNLSFMLMSYRSYFHWENLRISNNCGHSLELLGGHPISLIATYLLGHMSIGLRARVCVRISSPLVVATAHNRSSVIYLCPLAVSNKISQGTRTSLLLPRNALRLRPVRYVLGLI